MPHSNAWAALPFIFLLGLIALGPLFFAGWWGRNYGRVASALAILVVAYYCLGLKEIPRVQEVLHEYVSFITLVGSLFVVAGGIRMTVKGEATPFENIRFLFCGAIATNFLGTTGASMLLIRPWLRMNKYRVSAHHVVFFIFLISNVGGSLTPIGDPPLYLGLLKGVPFWWVLRHCWPMWVAGVGILLGCFYLIDRQNYLRAPKSVRERLAEPPDHFRFEGLGNFFFLAAILIAAFLERPPLLREAVMLSAAAASWFTTPARVHESNEFSFNPLKEVALLFIGIFATMMPALDWLESHAGGFGSLSPSFYYFASGSLSSVLDNAPTYLTFFNLAASTIDPGLLAQVQSALASPNVMSGNPEGHIGQIYQAVTAVRHFFGPDLAAGTLTPEQIRVAILLSDGALIKVLVAISIGSVFFGANTYIGNGPNFMVKAIADHQKVHTPGFIRYVLKYALPYMLTMLLIVWFVFFRH
jgi:Na+/H+ antiporter NhaD/arsenite permease-like protein